MSFSCEVHIHMQFQTITLSHIKRVDKNTNNTRT